MTSDPRQQHHPDTDPSAAASQGSAPSNDLDLEAANMRELKSRQTGYVTPLGISSKSAQAVLKQF